MKPIEDRLAASVKFDAFNGDSGERAIAKQQSNEAVMVIRFLRTRIAELEEELRAEIANESRPTQLVHKDLHKQVVEAKDARIAELEQSTREREAEIEASFPFVDKLRSTLYQIGQIADSDSCSPKMCEISELVDNVLAGTIELALEKRDE